MKQTVMKNSIIHTFPLMLALSLAAVLTCQAEVTVMETSKRLMMENESVRLVFDDTVSRAPGPSALPLTASVSAPPGSTPTA